MEKLQHEMEEVDDLRAEKTNLIEFVEKMKSENERVEEEYFLLKDSEKELQEQLDFLAGENDVSA